MGYGDATALVDASFEQVMGSYGTLVVLLLVMAGLVTLVGGQSLTSAMSLNVVERTKQIGVPRAMC